MRTIILTITLLWLGTVSLFAQQPPLRVAVIGGMTMSGMWQSVAESFEKTTHIPIEIVVTGDKQELDSYCRSHDDVDLVTMHSSDTITDLAGDGLFEQLTPWARNAQMLIGSSSNTAHIDANDSLEQALQKITQTHSPFLIHASGGTFEVFNDLSSSYGFGQNSDFIIFSTAKRGFLNDVAERKGYTLYGAIPFLMKKQHNSDLIGFTFEDKKLQRPYLAAIGGEKRLGNKQYQNAQKLLTFLTSDNTQQLIKHFRIDGHESIPVFFPIKP